jgi:hypothetical protein
MDSRLVLAPLLLLGLRANAQQDPDKPAETPAKTITELTTEKERLEAEIAFARDRAKTMRGDLAGKLTSRSQTFRAIAAGTTAPAAAAVSQRRFARLFEAAEKSDLAPDTLLTVNGRPIREGDVEGLLAYLRSLPNSGDDAMRTQRVLFELIRTEAVAAAFAENEAEARIGEVLGELEKGKPIADVAKSFGTVSGANDAGTVEVTRNSFLGIRIEQAAFSTEPGQRSRPIRTPQGFCVVGVDKIEKGSTPDLDKVTATVVQVGYVAEPAALQKAMAAPATGQVDIAVRDEKVLEMLPAMFRPAPTKPSEDQAATQIKALEEAIGRIDGEIEKLKSATDDASKTRLQQLETQRDQWRRSVAELRADGNQSTGEDQPPAKK